MSENLGLIGWIEELFKLHSSSNLFCTKAIHNVRHLDILRLNTRGRYQPIFHCIINPLGNMKSGEFYIDHFPDKLWDIIHNDPSTEHDLLCNIIYAKPADNG